MKLDVPPYAANLLLFNLHDPDCPGRLDRVKAVGAYGYRINVNWGWLEQMESDGQDPWRFFDAYFDRGHALGLRAMPLLTDTPVSWLSQRQQALLERLRHRGGWKPHYASRFAPEGVALIKWDAWTHQFASRYAGHGMLYDLVNEPDWCYGSFITQDVESHIDRPQSKAKIVQYADFVKRIARIIRRADPTAVICINGMPEYSEWWCTLGMLDFYKEVDLVLPHPYVRTFYGEPNRDSGDPWAAAGEIASLQKIVRHYNPRNHRIGFGIGEWGARVDGAYEGWQEWYHEQMREVAEATQSRLTVLYNFGESHPEWRVPEEPSYWQRVWGVTPPHSSPPAEVATDDGTG